ncbi:MAG: group II truncated hemoglobin [Phycisphaerales bacterium]|nr:group II truncated hemoglobin [Phycisphaerales bacterium]
MRGLVDRFYDLMRDEYPRLRGIHPPDDAHSREKLYEFLSGWLGGPPLYVQKHGHPRLRARHLPFAIDQRGVDEWLACMHRAMDDRGVAGALRAFLSERLTHTANFMRNC